MHSLLLLGLFLNIFLGLYVLTNNPKPMSNRVFALMCFSASIWSLTNYLTYFSPLIIWFQISYSVGAFVIFLGLIWVLLITNYSLTKSKFLILLCITLFISFLSYKSNLISESYTQPIPLTGVNNVFNWSLLLYLVFYLTFAFVILFRLNKFRLGIIDLKEKSQYRYIMIGASIALTTTAISSFLFPYFSIFISGGVDNIGFLVFSCFVTYSITKYNLFNIKITAIEFIVLLILTTLFIRTTLSASTQELLINVSLFTLIFILSVVLIQNTLREKQQRAQIEELALNLKDAYIRPEIKS